MQERDPLKCISHTQKIKEWVLENQDPPNEMFRVLIATSGLYPLISTSYKFINKVVVLAFVERWYPKTNTFHMYFGEMTITLDDVSCLLGIPIVSRGVSSPIEKLLFKDVVTLVIVELGVSPEELQAIRGMFVWLEWPRGLFCNVNDFNDPGQIGCATKGYLLFLLGCTLHR